MVHDQMWCKFEQSYDKQDYQQKTAKLWYQKINLSKSRKLVILKKRTGNLLFLVQLKAQMEINLIVCACSIARKQSHPPAKIYQRQAK